MNRFYIFLIAIACAPAAAFAQNEEEVKLRRPAFPKLSTYTSPAIKPDKKQPNNLAMALPDEKPASGRVFPTHHMPNAYFGDHTVSMPNAYQGDNCVPMPNLYRGKIIDRHITDSLTVDSLKGRLRAPHN